ncbi:ABC transporter substrate-binding protein [Streptomyces geranii]|uniref:ABC transporter substrate-binding protein n=1 Tax=Streptomyces geranii TaxID=2058923 RepID=UPI000D03A9D7|nr:ABC transporter substrate-binding protein [Streptomyces geranii]
MARRGLGRLATRLREGVWEIPLRRFLALLLVTGLVVGLAYGVREWTYDDRSCAPGVTRPEGSEECVGVSATDYSFGRPQLADTIRAIDRENDSLGDDYVTVALFEPFTATDADNLRDVLHELQGAYLAQWKMNHDANGETPPIRLVLANPGRTGAHWEHTVDQLEGMTTTSDRLRAVTGIGLSTEENTRAVRELTHRGIPVVGTSITADSLANGQQGSAQDEKPFPGLARVAPTNTDEARALASFAKVEADRAVLVYDDPGDPYTLTLQESFEKLLTGSRYQPWPFTSPADRTEEGTTANDFRQIRDRLCDTAQDVDTVLFAGRHTQLRQFINALGDRGCRERRFTILSGDDASYLTGDRKLDPEALKDGTISLHYSALAHPDAWFENPPSTGGSAADAQDLNDLLDAAEANTAAKTDKPLPIGEIGLEDGQLIVAYDAMRLTVTGIREATPGGESAPTLTDVRDQWTNVSGSARVNGASGWICLDNNGNPYNKAVPIVRLTHDRHADFVKIAWPTGKPPEKSCLPPPS